MERRCRHNRVERRRHHNLLLVGWLGVAVPAGCKGGREGEKVSCLLVDWVGGCGRHWCTHHWLSGWVWQMSVHASFVGWVGVADISACVIGWVGGCGRHRCMCRWLGEGVADVNARVSWCKGIRALVTKSWGCWECWIVR